MTRQEAIRIVGVVASAHPAWKATEATVELWVEMLSDLPFESTMTAVRNIIATSNDWPSIAAVRKAVAITTGRIGPDVDVACRQFLTRASGRPTDLHELVDETAQALGGWGHIRRSDNVNVLLGQFRQLYQVALTRTTTAATADPYGVGTYSLEGPSRPELTA